MDALWQVLPAALFGALPVVVVGGLLLFVSRWRSALIWSVALTGYFAAVFLWIAVLAPALNGTEPGSDAKAKAMLIGAASAGLFFPTVLGIKEFVWRRFNHRRGFPVTPVEGSD